MNKVFVTAMVLAVAVMLVACGGGKADEPAAPAPTPPPPPPAPEPEPAAEEDTDAPEQAAPVEGDADVLDDATDLLGGGELQELGSEVSEVACDSAERKITFTVVNSGVKPWHLDQDVSFGDTTAANVKIFINGFEANRGTPQYHPDTGEQMFGPNEKFSDNCGGTNVVEVGASVECTLAPVKLNRGTGSNDLKEVNDVFIDSPTVDDYKEFTC